MCISYALPITKKYAAIFNLNLPKGMRLVSLHNFKQHFKLIKLLLKKNENKNAECTMTKYI